MAIALYARVSTDSEDQAHALEQQLSRLREKAAAFGQEVLEFVDVASGTRDDRPQLKKLMQACESGQLETVLVTRLDRMTRSTVHGGKLMRLFNQPSWPNLICLDQAIDLSTANGRFFANLLMGMAQMESELIGERVQHGHRHARKQLKPQATKPPFGYRYTEGKQNYELDPEAAAIARQIVQVVLQTQSVRRGFDWQRDHGGTPFKSLEGMRRWLQNPALRGCRVYGTLHYKVDEQGERHRLVNRAGEVEQVIPGAHAPLLSEEQQQQVAAVIKRLSQKPLMPIQHRRARVLTGLLVCGHCGKRMFHRYPGAGRAHYMRCGQQICTARPRPLIREEVAIQALIDELARHKPLLAMGGLCDELRLQGAISDEALALQTTIMKLRALNDPELAEVIEHKEIRLDQLMSAPAVKAKAGFNLCEAIEALEDPKAWAELFATPEAQRRMFTQWIKQAVVIGKRVERVELRMVDPANAP